MTVPFLSSLPTATNAMAGTQQQFARFHQVRKDALSVILHRPHLLLMGTCCGRQALGEGGHGFADNNQKPFLPYYKQLDNLSRAFFIA